MSIVIQKLAVPYGHVVYEKKTTLDTWPADLYFEAIRNDVPGRWSIYANGADLVGILGMFTNIPKSNAPQCVWTGDTADFILRNIHYVHDHVRGFYKESQDETNQVLS